MRKYFIVVVGLLLMQQLIAQDKYYTNPILAGFYPDPSICRAGDDYYIVNSSFAYFPGLPLFHSKDLVNWEQIGHAMNRPEQLPLAGAGVSRGLFAPAITYHKGVFYIVCTLIDKLGNFVITAKDPKGPWSKPVTLPSINGIDPSLFFDDDDKAYILFNSIPPGNKSLHDGHRTIRMFEFDWQNLKVIGEEKLLINGGTDMAIKPVWIEGPHLLKKDNWYYLICAQGGTGYNHSEVVFRSRDVTGPYLSYEKNPILTQKQLDPGRPNPVTTTGHADFVQTKNGKWYAVFLGCRPYDTSYYNTGRETFMAPVTWKDGWPSILEGMEEVKYKYGAPMPELTKKLTNPFSGNLHYHDNFSQATLNDRWIFLRTLNDRWYSLSQKKGFVAVTLRPETCSGDANPSFIAHRQQNMKCIVMTALQFSATVPNEKAGLLIFQNERHFYYLCQSVNDGQPVVELYRGRGSRSGDTTMELIDKTVIAKKTAASLQLKIECNGNSYSFYYATVNGQWIALGNPLDAKFLSTSVAGGFVGSLFALYATSLGKESHTIAYYDWFDYKGNDDVYK